MNLTVHIKVVVDFSYTYFNMIENDFVSCTFYVHDILTTSTALQALNTNIVK